jgi:hypothetical protein
MRACSNVKLAELPAGHIVFGVDPWLINDGGGNPTQSTVASRWAAGKHEPLRPVHLVHRSQLLPRYDPVAMSGVADQRTCPPLELWVSGEEGFNASAPVGPRPGMTVHRRRRRGNTHGQIRERVDAS